MQIIDKARVLHGDCLDVLKTLADNSVDAVVTDPPYGLSFMGKKWDYDVPSVDVWAECLRVLKPGGHLLAFAGTRTQHRMAVRIEDAGFEIRDMIAWVYGSGFPKSHDVSKAIDKAAGVERTEKFIRPDFAARSNKTEQRESQVICGEKGVYTAPATEAARQWQGWGTALKPALEPITVARKPLIGTVAENVLAHGTGGLNIDGCRVPMNGEVVRTTQGGDHFSIGSEEKTRGTVYESHDAGRWPANLIHDGGEGVLSAFGVHELHNTSSGAKKDIQAPQSRFFYCAKASKRDRDEGLEGFDAKERQRQGLAGEKNNTFSRNSHPTVKPTELMRYLCRLVTPPNGIVLDPFTGSGSTGKAAMLEGFQFIGIEREAEYVEIARARIESAYTPPQEPDPQQGLF